jgi:hypothetical protein
MNEMARDPVLWTGLVMLAGALGAMAARAVRAPAACGAMAGGFALAAGMSGDGWHDDGSLIPAMLLALLTFLLGAELDLPRLVRIGRWALGTLALQAIAIIGLVYVTCRGLGIENGAALAVAVAAIASSPAAIIAVASESRARGDFTQQLLLSTSVSFLLAATLVSFAWGAPGSLLWVGAGVAGFMAGNFLKNREVIRGALRDLALPCAVALFAMAGSRVTPSHMAPLLVAAAALLAARAAALILAATITRGRSIGVLQAGLIPMAGVIIMAPALEGLEVLLVAGFLSECLGMIGTRWALVRSGEAAGGVDDPDAWRARMR